MIDPIGAKFFLSMAVGIQSYVKDLTGASEKRRKEIAQYLDDVSTTLHNIGENARNEKDLDRDCAALNEHLWMLTELMEARDHRTFELIQKIKVAAVGRVSLTRKRYIYTDYNIREELRQIDEACGIFKATASYLRVTERRQWWQFWKG